MKDCVVVCKGMPFKNILHIGAHTGQEGKAYQENGAEKVYWVEANPEYMDKLKQNTAELKLQQTYINACLSDVNDEEVEFKISNNEQSSSMLDFGTHAKMYPHVKFVKSISLKTKRVDKILSTQDLKLIDFVNIDVQGAELKVLKGFGDALKNNKNIRAIYCEINFEHVYENCCLAEELDSYLKQCDFERILTCSPERTWGDALWRRN